MAAPIKPRNGDYSIETASIQRIARKVSADVTIDPKRKIELVEALSRVVNLFNEEMQSQLERRLASGD